LTEVTKGTLQFDKAVIADDSSLIPERLTALIAARKTFELVGQAGNGTAAIGDML
jgi:DNA-binding NarL/FixJ family response regulator